MSGARSRTPLISAGNVPENRNAKSASSSTAFSNSSIPGAYYSDLNLIAARIGSNRVPGGMLSSLRRPDPAADSPQLSGADDERTNSSDGGTDTFGGGFDVFMSGITIHFKPLRYDHIRDWVVNKLGGVYAGIQNAGIADVENGLVFPSFVRRLSEDGSVEVRSEEVDGRESADVEPSQGSGSDLSFLFNTVSGIYYLLNPSDDHHESQTPGIHTSRRDLSPIPGATSTEITFARRSEVLAEDLVEETDKLHLQSEGMNSFDLISGEEDYDVLYLDDDDVASEGMNAPSSPPVTEVADNLEIIDAGDAIDESEIWDVVSQDEADDWDLPVSFR
ncbi:hypothetical protein V1517DRAFT_317213 [Lipomyces orientalis]|uniref:Uncharacterized protein n=1 Tax=Lipomyces orientalis TaxID=1233043 RepID=A0ACC3TTP4_9ASCO